MELAGHTITTVPENNQLRVQITRTSDSKIVYDNLIRDPAFLAAAGGGGGDASEATLQDILTELGLKATEVTLQAVLTELGLKANLTDTQPVSVDTLPEHDVTNQGTFPVQPELVVRTPTKLTPVAASVTSVTLVAANAARKGVEIHNKSTTGTLYISLSATADATEPRVLGPGDTYLMTDYLYTGVISGIWDIASGQANIEEIT